MDKTAFATNPYESDATDTEKPVVSELRWKHIQKVQVAWPTLCLTRRVPDYTNGFLSSQRKALT